MIQTTPVITVTSSQQQMQQQRGSSQDGLSENLIGSGHRVRKPLSVSQIIDATVLHVLFGWTGALHFYLGRPVWGLVYLCTFGLLGIGWAYDFLRLPSLIAEYNKGTPASCKPFALDEAYVCWLSFGWIGGHHLYLHNYGRALLYFATVGGLGVLFAIDFFLLPGLVTEANNKLAAIKTQRPTWRDDPKDIHAPCVDACIVTKETETKSLGAALGDDETLIVKSTTIYTPSDQGYTTDSHAVILAEGAGEIPFAFPVGKKGQNT